MEDGIFTTIIHSLHGAGERDMLDLARTMLRGMERIGGVKLFAVVNEAEVAAEYLNDYFRSSTTGLTAPHSQCFC